MKLHTDGTIEGTPEEVAAYKRELYPVLVTEGRIKPPDYPLPGLRTPLPCVDHAISQSTIASTGQNLKEPFSWNEWTGVLEKMDRVRVFKFPKRWLERYTVLELLEEVDKRKKVARETGMYL